MEGFNKKEKNLKPIEAAAKILRDIGISQLAEAELSDNENKPEENKSEFEMPGRKHRGGSVPSVFEKINKVSGPGKDELEDDESDEGFTNL